MSSRLDKLTKEEILSDYKLINLSRNCSVIGRKQVLSGKAKFGIFGDGKELAQVVLAKFFKDGDWRSGYYRDQTLMMAIGVYDAKAFFAQLYGQTDIKLNPDNAGRVFNNHFASRSLNEDGSWKNLMEQKNTSPDISPTAGQMPRLVGLGWASKLFRNNPELHQYTSFTAKGNEVAFGTIGDASTSEGHFWEAINALGVLQVPVAVSIWDDGYGISVPQKYQTTKQDLSELLSGFVRTSEKPGIELHSAKGWDYEGLIAMYEKGVDLCRKEHIPTVFHVKEVTQPQGHSTSGSHERYKSKERLQWEKDHDPILKMRQWILEKGHATEAELVEIENEAEEEAKQGRKEAWREFKGEIKAEQTGLLQVIDRNKKCVCAREKVDKLTLTKEELQKIHDPIRKDNFSAAKKLMRHICKDCPSREPLQRDITAWLTENYRKNKRRYSSHLYSESEWSPLSVDEVAPVYAEDAEVVNGRVILRENFDYIFKNNPLVVTFGEDVGQIGGVNQTLEGLQKKYGEVRITDTGIREATILGQGIGLALRGMRPIAEIQYFDYLLYALQGMSDDLATVHYRTGGGQKAPVIVRTRGHRLEGIWHSGSPVSMVLNSIRGMHLCLPRNMTQAAGFYNTLIEGDDPALVVEPLNGYRIKEKMPENIGQFKVPLGVPEVLKQGTDITLVTYGSCVRIAQDAVEQLQEFDISVELIDVQTLLPFDVFQKILESVKKTNRILFFDEDVPGGATSYMMQKVLEEQKAYYFLDSEPRTLTAMAHRPAYTTDGDYFSNPNAEDVFEAIYNIMNEADPEKYPKIY